ncbi:MAG: YceI family protein [Balneolaceae bacterium]
MTIYIRIILLSLLWICFNNRIVTAQEYITRNGTAVFTSSVPLHEFQGVSNHLTGLINFETGLVDFFLDLETLETGNNKRDKDMRLTLDTKNFPFAEFTGNLRSTPDLEDLNNRAVTVMGTFTINGVTNQMEITGTLNRNNEKVSVQASWEINLKDFDIDPPGILFYRVDEIVKIEIEALLKPEN